MDGAIVAGETGVAGGFCGKGPGLLHMAGDALFFENGVDSGHPAAGVHTMVAGKTTPGDPDQREQRQQEAEPEFRAFQRRRPLEIVEVDALGEFLCCACACHVSPENRNWKLENRKAPPNW